MFGSQTVILLELNWLRTRRRSVAAIAYQRNAALDYDEIHARSEAARVRSEAAAYRLWRSEKGDASLTPLIESLRNIVGLLQRDETSPWSRVFEAMLEQAVALQASEFKQDDLTRLSIVVRKVYSGMCGFNEYVPSENGKIAYWIDVLERARAQLFSDAVRLQVDLD